MQVLQQSEKGGDGGVELIIQAINMIKRYFMKLHVVVL
jgi:hypothetical protein